MQISRLELYELVSTSPLSKVAPGLGISATTLATICREHGVPYPGSGYWTRKSLGQDAVLEPLPQSSDANERLINIEPRRPRASNTPTVDAVAEATSDSEQLATLSNAPVVKERLTKPHPIIAGWIADHERRRREAKASRDPWRIDMAPAPMTDVDHRRHRILDALFRTLEARNAKISVTEKGLLRVTIDSENIDFQIREKNRQVRILPEDRRNSYRSQELVGTGKLIFAIRTYLRGPHDEEWRETNDNPLEGQLPKIVNRLFEGARILKAWHIELEQDAERRRQEAAQRAERARLAKLEQSRRQKLEELARDWHTANQIRDFVAAIKSKPFDRNKEIHGKSLAEWVAWAEATADALDTIREGPEVPFSIIGGMKIEQGSGL